MRSNEPWDGVGSTRLEVVGLTSSALPVEPAAGRPQGGEAAVVARALLEPSCVPKALLPGAAWPLSPCHGPECFVAYQSQCQHRCCTPRCTCCCPKRGSGGGCPGQRRSCTATAARAWRSKGDTGCAKCQCKGCGRALVLCCLCLSLWGDRSCCDPSLAALAAYPSASACSLPPGHRHVTASQRPCLCCEGPTSWSLCHGGGLPEKEGET